MHTEDFFKIKLGLAFVSTGAIFVLYLYVICFHIAIDRIASRKTPNGCYFVLKFKL